MTQLKPLHIVVSNLKSIPAAAALFSAVSPLLELHGWLFFLVENYLIISRRLWESLLSPDLAKYHRGLTGTALILIPIFLECKGRLHHFKPLFKSVFLGRKLDRVELDLMRIESTTSANGMVIYMLSLTIILAALYIPIQNLSDTASENDVAVVWFPISFGFYSILFGSIYYKFTEGVFIRGTSHEEQVSRFITGSIIASRLFFIYGILAVPVSFVATIATVSLDGFFVGIVLAFLNSFLMLLIFSCFAALYALVHFVVVLNWRMHLPILFWFALLFVCANIKPAVVVFRKYIEQLILG